MRDKNPVVFHPRARMAIGRNNFPLVLAEGETDFASRRRRLDVSQLLKGI
jgi:hypothetical protein